MNSPITPTGTPPVPESTAPVRAIAIWLLLCCALIFAMVVLGGVTRLTGSGLSMVRWEPLSGVIPPLNLAAWQAEFVHYRQFPEYQKVNVGMTLAGFKTIFYFEFAHRLLGRTIGLVFLLPFLYFLWRRRLPRSLAPHLVVMFVLGALQGLLGWYMVKSGLADVPHVSQYRLTAHLAAAILIYLYMLWVAFSLLASNRPRIALAPYRTFAAVLGVLAVATVLSGGFVAGLKAGHAFNTFPLMAGQWFPPGYIMLEPAWRNFFENIPTVQFNHRVLAITTYLLVLAFTGKAWRDMQLTGQRKPLGLLALVATLQVALGIATLLLHVPVTLAASHQGVALLLLSVMLYVIFICWHQGAPLKRARLGSR